MNPHIDEILVAIKALGALFGAIRSRRVKTEPSVTTVAGPIQVYVTGDLPHISRLTDTAKTQTLDDNDGLFLKEVVEGMWAALLTADDYELEGLYFRTQELLSLYPEKPEILQLQSKIVGAINFSRRVRIFTSLQLMLWLFVVIKFVALKEKIQNARALSRERLDLLCCSSPRSKGFGLLFLTLRACRA